MAKLFGMNGEEIGGDGAEAEPILSDEQMQAIILSQAAGHKIRGLPFPTDAEVDALQQWCIDTKVRAMMLQGMLEGRVVACLQAGWDGPEFLPIDGMQYGDIQREDTGPEDQGAAGE